MDAVTSTGKQTILATGNNLFLLLALAGLSFLFFVGFPFANHNESYWWVILLDKISFFNSLTQRLEPVQSFRPLGTATAWLTYKIAGSIYLQQLVNWLLACLSFAVLFKYVKNKAFFSTAAFFATAGFFAGYIYLFHLHGVFYGPLQLYIAVLTSIAYTQRAVTTRKLLFLFLLTVVAALYHTFALLVFAGYAAGCMLEVPKTEWRAQLPKLFGFLTVSLVLIYGILQLHPSKTEGDLIKGTLASFTTTEINTPLSLLAALFALITAYTTPLRSTLKLAYLLLVAAGAAILLVVHLPILLLWIAACIIKMMVLKRWAVSAVVASTAVFPVATHTGTPTYIVFVIMVAVFVMAINNPIFNTIPRFYMKGVAILIVMLFALLMVLKANIKVPVVAKALQPVLAEQEKTHQMEAILAWKKSTAMYNGQTLRFNDESAKPAASGNAVNRKHRPPTQQGYLNRYMGWHKNNSLDSTVQPLLVTFGGKTLNNRKAVFEVKGTWSGSAYVYE